MSKIFAGIDIGGTKCAVSIGAAHDQQISILDKVVFSTAKTYEETIDRLTNEILSLLHSTQIEKEQLLAIGISCGGPLNSKEGIILSPPNLIGWDNVRIVDQFQKVFNIPIGLQNDANACALAEYMWGAGQGTSNMIFLTFGTGMGTGLIFNGQLYSGANDNAGEAGHIRLSDHGPLGYNKFGSFEGFCSGSGIAQLAQLYIKKQVECGGPMPQFYYFKESINEINAKDVGLAARNGDQIAIDIYKKVGQYLGRGLAILIDVLNPERIVIGSIYVRQQALIEPYLWEELHQEALPEALKVCEIVPAGLGEYVGDYAALSVAKFIYEKYSQSKILE